MDYPHKAGNDDEGFEMAILHLTSLYIHIIMKMFSILREIGVIMTDWKSGVAGLAMAASAVGSVATEPTTEAPKAGDKNLTCEVTYIPPKDVGIDPSSDGTYTEGLNKLAELFKQNKISMSVRSGEECIAAAADILQQHWKEDSKVGVAGQRETPTARYVTKNLTQTFTTYSGALSPEDLAEGVKYRCPAPNTVGFSDTNGEVKVFDGKPNDPSRVVIPGITPTRGCF